MKNNSLSLFLFLGFVFSSGAEVVYNNTTNSLRLAFTNNVEFGDQVILGGTGRQLTSFALEYSGTNFSGNETARVRFYKNDGPGSVGQASPGTLMWDSEPFQLPVAPQGLSLTWPEILHQGKPVIAPETFTWTIQFGGISPNEMAGLSVYSPPTIGSNFTDYWEFGPLGWQLRKDPVRSIDFAAIFTADPVLRFTSVKVRAGKVELKWDGVAGYSYQVQTSTTLNTNSWTAISPNVFATSASVNWTNNVNGQFRFYRVIKL